MSEISLLDQIKTDIVSGSLERGRPLRQLELSERYGVSRIPIRDAISILRNQGWLVPHGKAGSMIPELCWHEAEDLYQMRSILESRLLEFAFDRLTFETLGRARDINHQLNSDTLSLIERGQLNWEFHATLYQAANRPTLFNVVSGLNEQVRRYLGFQYGPLKYKDVSQTEHDTLLRFLEQKDKQGATELLKHHIEAAGTQLVRYLKSTTNN
ncbi:GntR family transcriptional regulator [Rhodanobacter aciditrophus]|uniref:GntR family transcriptional regulator n=1 Tax=Rhodanobacter aciditrophus TaxID=1623218 RepID=A0ABW4B302_9GAMM